MFTDVLRIHTSECLFTCVLRIHTSECLNVNIYTNKSVHDVPNISCTLYDDETVKLSSAHNAI